MAASTDAIPQDHTIGFIGLGAMGTPMAKRLAAAGFKLILVDADADRARALAKELTASQASTAREAAMQCRLLITMLPSSDIVAAVLEGEHGVLAGLQPGTLLIEMSSGSPARTRMFATQLEGRGARLIDAPVSGGVQRAISGDLAIMVGGGDHDIARAEPVLKAMGSSLLRTGAIGTAHAMKALNNLVSAGGLLISIEALLIGQRFGLNPGTMVDVLNASTGMNNSTQKKLKQFVLSRRFDAGFGLDLMVKDLGIAVDVAHDTDTEVPFASLCRDMWARAREVLGPGQDHTAIAKLCEQLAGSELRG